MWLDSGVYLSCRAVESWTIWCPNKCLPRPSRRCWSHSSQPQLIIFHMACLSCVQNNGKFWWRKPSFSLKFSLCVCSQLKSSKKIFGDIFRIRQEYKWGFDFAAPLPTAYILPKPTRDFQKARPIVNYSRSWILSLGTHFSNSVVGNCQSCFPKSVFYMMMFQRFWLLFKQYSLRHMPTKSWLCYSKTLPDFTIRYLIRELLTACNILFPNLLNSRIAQ